MIPDEIITEIKTRADIGAVIGRTVKLRKQGRNLLGLCPFHTEKSPSFNVRPDEGFFYCFGCRAAGDVVEFLVKSSGRGFLDIITELAAETGVAIPQQVLSVEESAAQKERKRILKVVELTQVFFRTRLNSDDGRLARAYLQDVRKLDEETIDSFGLGFGGVGDDALQKFLVGQGHSVDDAVRAGVLGRSERGVYDFYRQRITIPVRNPRGEVVTFGGRIFGKAAEPWRTADGTMRTPPKYLNGPQSSVYDKSNILYGLNEAQAALKQGKPAVLVEGYFDAIAVHRAGLKTAVAPCGTSLTDRHVEELKRRCGDKGRVVVCLDADRAGQEAAAKAILMLLVADVDTGFVVLPEKDPDQLVQEGRIDELRNMLLGAPSAIDFLVQRAKEKASGSVQSRVAAIDTLLPFLAAPSRELVRKEAIRAAANAFGEDESVLAREVQERGRRSLWQTLRGTRSDPSKGPQRPGSAGSSSSSSPQSGRDHGRSPAPAPPKRIRPKSPPLDDVEVQLAKIVLCHPELAPRVALLLPHLENHELKAFVGRVVDALVRFHDLPPRDALTRVPVARRGQLVALADKVRLDGPDRVLGLTTAMSMVEAMSTDFLERQGLEAELGVLLRHLTAADDAGDHEVRKQLLLQQKAVVEALQALEAPKTSRRQIGPAVQKAVAALPAPPPSALQATAVDAELDEGASVSPSPSSSSPSSPRPAPAAPPPPASVAPQAKPPQAPPPQAPPPLEDPPWAGDFDDDPWAV